MLTVRLPTDGFERLYNSPGLLAVLTRPRKNLDSPFESGAAQARPAGVSELIEDTSGEVWGEGDADVHISSAEYTTNADNPARMTVRREQYHLAPRTQRADVGTLIVRLGGNEKKCEVHLEHFGDEELSFVRLENFVVGAPPLIVNAVGCIALKLDPTSDVGLFCEACECCHIEARHCLGPPLK